MKTLIKILPFLIVSTIILFTYSCSDKDDDDKLKIKYFMLNKEEISFDIAESVEVIGYKTNQGEVELEVSDNWCKAKVLSETEIEVKVEECGDDIDERKAEIKVKTQYESKVITVTQSALEDVKVKIASAEAEYSHSANGIGLSFDGDYGTYFMSHWSQTQFPFNVIYNFRDVKKIDFFVYHPRSGGEKKNGLLNKLEVWYATKSNPTFVKYSDYDFEASPDKQEITFTPALVNPTQIKFVLYQGYGTGTYAAIGEMEFFRAGKKI